jgi:alpha-1,3-glucan synthase
LCLRLVSGLGLTWLWLQFTDADGGVAHDFVEKLQSLTPDNSRKELSIEAYLTKSEEAFFDKVRKDKLDAAASIRSSQRDSVWGTPAPSTFDYASRPVCELPARVAPRRVPV